jgi:prepilin-type N-terminal cleavage/methylation domain-containing protein
MNRKGVTLVELILAAALVGVIILAAFSLDTTAHRFFTSSDRKARVLNEMMFVMEHIQKNAARVTGFVGRPGYNVAANVLEMRVADSDNDPTRFDDDVWVQYRLSGNRIIYDPDMFAAGSTDTETLTERVITNGLNFSELTDGDGSVYGVRVSLQGEFTPGDGGSERNNPSAELNTTVFFREHSAN